MDGYNNMRLNNKKQKESYPLYIVGDTYSAGDVYSIGNATVTIIASTTTTASATGVSTWTYNTPQVSTGLLAGVSGNVIYSQRYIQEEVNEYITLYNRALNIFNTDNLYN